MSDKTEHDHIAENLGFIRDGDYFTNRIGYERRFLISDVIDLEIEGFKKRLADSLLDEHSLLKKMFDEGVKSNPAEVQHLAKPIGELQKILLANGYAF